MAQCFASIWKRMRSLFKKKRKSTKSENETTQLSENLILQPADNEKETIHIFTKDIRNDMATIPYVNRKAQVPVKLSGLEKLRLMLKNPDFPKLPLDLSNLESVKLILSKELEENLHLKMNELTQYHMILILKFEMEKKHLQNSVIHNRCKYMAIIPCEPQARDQQVPAVHSTIAQRGMEMVKSTPNVLDFLQLLKIASDAKEKHKNNIESKNDLIKDYVFDESNIFQKPETLIFSLLDTLKEIFVEKINSGLSITINTSINDRKVFSQKMIRTENINKDCNGNANINKRTMSRHRNRPVIAALLRTSNNRQSGYDDQHASVNEFKIRSQRNLIKDAFSESSVDKKL